MFNENEKITTPETTEPHAAEKAPTVEAAARPALVRVHDDSTPGPAAEAIEPYGETALPADFGSGISSPSISSDVEKGSLNALSTDGSAPAREDLYPRADGPIEADRDIPQMIDEGNSDDEEDPAVPVDGSPPNPMSAAPGAPPQQGSEPRDEMRRRRRRRRGGERGKNAQTRQDRNQGHAQPPAEGPEAAADRPEQPGRFDGHHDGGRGDNRRGDRHRDGHGGLGQERTNTGKSLRGPVKREVLANTSFEETRIAILENGRLSELHWERKSSQNIVGNVYRGTVENVLPGISSAFVNIGLEKNAYLYISDVLGDKNAPIDQTLKKGQTVMIQVAKEAISTKGPKVTMDVSLPGRYLVFTPYQEYVGVSKHIAEPEERQRLELIVAKLVKTHLGGKGVVVRTEAEGASEEELEREVKYLQNLWAAVSKKYQEQSSPGILHQDLGLAMQIARDILSDQVYVYLLDSKESQKQVIDFVDGFAPELKDRIKLYEGKTPIFKAFNIEGQIATIRETKVALPNGGSIVIQEAESLCAVDVNTGRFTGSKSQEETVTQTNIEAAILVAQQLRLRNIGGIIVVDFIDMRKASNRAKVMEAFADACKADRAKIRILPITRLGLIELTRERKRMSTAALLTAECHQCRASGRVLSTETLRIKIQREILEMTGGHPGGSIRISLYPAVADSFRGQQPIIEKNIQRTVRILSDPNLMWEDYHIILD